MGCGIQTQYLSLQLMRVKIPLTTSIWLGWRCFIFKLTLEIYLVLVGVLPTRTKYFLQTFRIGTKNNSKSNRDICVLGTMIKGRRMCLKKGRWTLALNWKKSYSLHFKIYNVDDFWHKWSFVLLKYLVQI